MAMVFGNNITTQTPGMLNCFAELMVIQYESSHRNTHIIRRVGGHDACRLLGAMEHHPGVGTSITSVLRLG